MTPSVENLHSVQAAISKAADQAERAPTDITLVAVSKTFDGDHIRPVLEDGHRIFGENRVQESAGKWPGLRDVFDGIELHLIGPLQTNKVSQAINLFDVIETVDRPKLARELAKELAKRPAEERDSKSFYIQVNTGEEDQKAGVAPLEVDEFVALCRDELGLNIVGLMCIPPVDEPAAPHFALLADMAKRNGLAGLSMGMSGDYETAVMMGATHIRVGSAIFGARAPYTGPA